MGPYEQNDWQMPVKTFLNAYGGPLYSEVQVEQVWTCLGGSLCVEFQYIMGNGHMERPTEQNDWQTDTTETLPSRNFLRRS